MAAVNSASTQPIGIFDSGIGGLTVAHAIVKHMPHENMIYFGDTAHLPYGDKSPATIQAYSLKIAQILLEHQCKLILIACNTASAAAYDAVKKYIADRALVMNVIDPTIQVLNQKYANQHVGLIGTRQTVHSKVYQHKVAALNQGITLTSHATNLLATAIEEFGDHPVIDSLLAEYLTHPNFKTISALVLACTHYPIIKHKVSHYFNHQIDIIDSSDAVAQAVKTQLQRDKLHNANDVVGSKQFYISDYTDSFVANSQLFFKEKIALHHHPLWE